MAQEGTGTNQNQAGNDDTQGKPAKVVFSPEQQERVNELIREAMGRAGREHREAAEKAVSELNAAKERLTQLEYEIKSFRQGKDNSGNKPSEDFKAEVERIKAAHTEEVSRMKSTLSEAEKRAAEAEKTMLSVKKQVAIQAAASKINFIDIGVVNKLTEENIQWDPARNRFIVVVDGKERMNNAFEPMSLDEFYVEFAAKNPFLVRGDARPGTGSTPSNGVSANGRYKIEDIFGPKSKGALAAKLKREDPAEYRRMKEIARESGLVA